MDGRERRLGEASELHRYSRASHKPRSQDAFVASVDKQDVALLLTMATQLLAWIEKPQSQLKHINIQQCPPRADEAS